MVTELSSLHPFSSILLYWLDNSDFFLRIYLSLLLVLLTCKTQQGEYNFYFSHISHQGHGHRPTLNNIFIYPTLITFSKSGFDTTDEKWYVIMKA